MKIRKLYQSLLLIALVVACILLAVVVAVKLDDSLQTSANSVNINQELILIDPGHGGEDGGTVSADGTVEKTINLSISQPLADMLRICGYRIQMTRDDDYSIYDTGLKSIKQQKVSDLKNRLKLYDQSRLVVSIHQNHFSQSKYYGTQIFYGVNHSESKPLAECIRKNVVSMLQPENTRELKKGTKDIYLLYQTSQPAVIVECGFLSNPEELAKLKDAEYQKKMAFAIACGVMDYEP